MLYAHYLWGIIPLSCLLILATANSHIGHANARDRCTVDDCLRALQNASRSADSNTLCSAIINQTNLTVTVTETVHVTQSPTIDRAVTSRLDIAVTSDAETGGEVASEAETETSNHTRATQDVPDRKSATPSVTIPEYLRVCRPSGQLTSACACFLGATAATSPATYTSSVTVTHLPETVDTSTQTIHITTHITSTTTVSPSHPTQPAGHGGSGFNTSSLNIRIEGPDSTIFEGSIASSPRNITTKSGGTHLCNGLNHNANSQPGATSTTALDAAVRRNNLTFDATWSDEFDDFFITQIASTSQTDNKYWGLLINWKFANAGGCQQETKPGDHVLWAYDAFNADHILQLSPSEHFTSEKGTGSVGLRKKLYVRDGMTGEPVQNVTVQTLEKSRDLGGVATVSDENGVALVNFKANGTYYFKATKESSVTSNLVTILAKGA